MATAKTTKTTSKKTTSPRSIKSSASMSSSSSSKPVTLSNIPTIMSDAKNKRIALIVGGVIIVAALAYLGKGFLFAAFVNGEPISRVAIVQELERQGGKQVLDRVITRKLIAQQAKNKNIIVTQKEIDTEFNKIQKQYSDAGQNLDQLLQAQGLKKDKFMDEVRTQLLVEKILGKDTKLTDQEVNDFLAKNQDLLANEKDQEAGKKKLRDQLQQQKLADKYKAWIGDLRKKSKIQYLVSY